MKRFLCSLTVCLTLFALASPAQAQHKQRTHKHATEQKAPKKVYVDDESCGCELVFIDGIQTIQKDSLFGFKLEDGTVIVPPKYKFVDEFHGDYCLVLTDYDKYGLINRRGKEILPCKYKEIAYPSDGIIKARENDLYAFYDTTGREILKPQWPSASNFFGGIAVVGVNIDSSETIYGFIDTTGRYILKPAYQYAYPFLDGRAVVVQYDRYGLIDTTGKEIIPIKYLIMSTPNEGRVFARDEEIGLIAMFDLNGKRITDFRYNDVLYYGEGLYTVVISSDDGNRQYYLDAKGRERFGTFDRAGKFINGFAMVEKNGKAGIINSKGKSILPCDYDNSGIRPEEYIFHEGLALIEKAGSYGFVNTKGKIVIPIQYESAFYFSEGLAPVRKNNLWGYINSKGEEVIPFMFGPCSAFEYGRASVIYNNQEYKINPGGQCVKACATFPASEVQRRMAELAVKRHNK